MLISNTNGTFNTNAVSSTNEWYTPSRFIVAAKEVMGGSIDLDPASCATANNVIQAAAFYDKELNGLLQPWHGNVWLNPPFGKTGNTSNLELFVMRAMNFYYNGQVEQACILTPRVSAIWRQYLLEFPMCEVTRRIHFWTTGTNNWRPIFGCEITYLGKNEQKFIDVFSQFGRIVKAIDDKHMKPVNLSLF